jgi:serine/threonine protein kinase/tetratricopeptide (TPR) repeat protein
MHERSIFMEALDLNDPREREALLLRACGDDDRLRARVEALLHRHENAEGFVLDREPEVDLAATADLAPPPEEPGTTIGPYRLMEQIGEGGMGVVYVAEQHQPVRRRVALKIIKPGMDTKQVIARFEAERQALAMMDHPNIAKVHDGGTTESGRPYFVMELVRGIPITDYCDREKLSIPERLELFVLVCRAVQHAHQKGIIHRDLKPSNILVTVIDGAAVPKVIDFGVAKATGASLTERTIYTAFQQFVGTPLYMSPEQADLSGMDVDTRSDIYALGVLLYELLTGTPPFDAETLRRAAFDEMRRIIREEEPQRPSTRLSSLGETLTTISARRKADPRRLGPSMRGELDWIVMKALEKDRRRRYETANDFAADVMRYLSDQPVEACPPSAGYRLGKFLRRNRGPVAAGLALSALLALGTVGTSIGLVRALRAETKAKQAEAGAKEEAAIAKAVKDFLQLDLLEQANPLKNARSKKVTVEEVLGRAAARIAGKFAQRPQVEAEIRMTIGRAYYSLGDYTAAQPHIERAYEITSNVLGEDHISTLDCMYSLARLYETQRKFAQAEPLYARALDVSRRVRGEDDVGTINLMRYLAYCYGDQRKFAQAEPLLVRALEVVRRWGGEDHPRTLDCMNSLAGMYMNQGKFDQAEPLLARALDVSRRVRGEEDAATINLMNNLGYCYKEQRKFDQAEPLLARALEVASRRWGEESEEAFSPMDNLAKIYIYQGKLSKGEALHVKRLEVTRRRLGDQHPRTFRPMIMLGSLYLSQARLAEAEPLLVNALEGCQRIWGEEHPDTLAALSLLAELYRLDMRFQHSIPLLEGLLKATRARSGPDHPDALHAMAMLGDSYRQAGRVTEGTDLLEQAWARARERPDMPLERLASIADDLGEAYEQAGQFAKAESLRREALETVRQRYKETSSQSAAMQAVLARNLLKVRRYAEAEPLLRECLSFREQNESDNWRTFNTRSMLGGSLMGQKKYAEAEPMLLAGYEGMKRREVTIPPAVKIRLTEAIERLVQLYEATGEPGKAAVWRARLGRADLPADVFARP